MQKNIRVKSICALAGVALTLGATGSANASGLAPAAGVDADATTTARLRVEAGVAVPVNVSSASVGVRKTKVGPIDHKGDEHKTDPIAAGTKVKVIATLHSSTSAGGTVAITSSNVKDAVVVDFDDKKDDLPNCFGIGVDYTADVAVSAGATSSTLAQAWGSFAVMVGDKTIHSWDSAKIALNGGASIKDLYKEPIGVQTGADVCLPDVVITPEAAADVVADAAAGVKVTG